jgi:DNA-binding GntR family transcriptional regulator
MAPRTLSQEILTMLNQPRTGTNPLSISHLARAFGASSTLVRSCAQQLVADGTARASMATRNGVETIQGLIPLESKAAVPAAV